MLTAIALTGTSIERFLDAWFEAPGEAPLRHLAEFAQTHATLVLMRHRPSNSYWGIGQRAAAVGVASWIRGGRPRQRLVDGFFDAQNSAAEEELSNAVRIMEALEALPLIT